jgi:hypothetical protein
MGPRDYDGSQPLHGRPVTLTLTYNGVLSSTADAQGGAHFTGTCAGTIEVVPVDPSLPTYTGHFAQWLEQIPRPTAMVSG